MYGNFEVNPVKLLAISSAYDGMTQQCSSVVASLDNIKNSLRSGCFEDVKSVLDTLACNVREESSNVTGLKDTLASIANAYQNAESVITAQTVSRIEGLSGSGESGSDDSSTGTSDDGSAGTSDDDADFSWDDLWSLLSSPGSITATMVPYMKMVLSGLTGEEINATILADILNSTLNKYAFFADVAENGWKEAVENGIGISAYMPEGTVPGETFGSYLENALKQELSDFNPTTAAENGARSLSSGAQVAKAAAKWGGVALSGITQGYENYQEYKSGEISAGRAVAEGVIETGVDVGLGIGATAAVGAGLAAAGVVAAPALVVGGIATAAVIGVNAIAKKASGGKDLGELASDFICDGAKSIGSSVAKWFK